MCASALPSTALRPLWPDRPTPGNNMKNQETPPSFSIVNAALLPELNRRDLLKGAGLTLAVLGGGSLLNACAGGTKAEVAPLAAGHFLRIGTDSTVTVISPNTELGQGAYTGLATLVAEE